MQNVCQLKNTGYYINEDSSKTTMNIRAGLWGKVKRLRGEGYCAVIKFDIYATNKRDAVARELVHVIKNLR